MKPAREHATNNAQTYFVTSDTWERRALFHAEPWARLFFKTLLSHRGESDLLHEFVLMPDHFHLLITPSIAIERAIQLIKDGFSFHAKKELGSNMEIWRRGFADHRVRDAEDYDKHLHYIHLNPVKKHLCASPAEYRYSSAYPGWKLDPVPQGLNRLRKNSEGTAKGRNLGDAKPSTNPRGSFLGHPGAIHFSRFLRNRVFPQPVKPGGFWGPVIGTTEVVPFQNQNTHGLKPGDFIGIMGGTTEVVPFQSTTAQSLRRAEAVSFQSLDDEGLKPALINAPDVRAEARTLHAQANSVAQGKAERNHAT